MSLFQYHFGLRLNDHRAALGHGIAGIGGEIEDRQFQLIAVGQHWLQIFGKARFDTNARSERTAQQPGDALHQLRDIHRFGLEFLTPGEGQHALGQRDTAQGPLGGVLQQTGDFRRVADAFLHDLEIAENHRQQVVEVMGDAAAELADRLHLLRLEQRLAGLFQGLLRLVRLGHITGDLGKAEQRAGVAANRIDDHVGKKPRAVLAHPPTAALEPAFAGGNLQRALRLAEFAVFGV